MIHILCIIPVVRTLVYDCVLLAVAGQWKRRQHTPQLSTSVSDHGLCSGSSRCGQ